MIVTAPTEALQLPRASATDRPTSRWFFLSSLACCQNATLMRSVRSCVDPRIHRNPVPPVLCIFVNFLALLAGGLSVEAVAGT